MGSERREWPLREHWIDLAWATFTLVNLAAMLLLPQWETVPFHFIWVSLTVLYGFRVWSVRPTLWVLAAVMITTAAFIAIDVTRNQQPVDEITEVPLMAAMFLAMVWHARRHLTATREIERISEANLRLLEGERQFVQDASHELRTPITVALGHAELIQRATGDPMVADDARVIADELTRLRRIADRLLLLAALEDPNFLLKTRVEIGAILMDALNRWAPTPRSWRLGHIDEAYVDADADRLALAFDALIENAVEHTGTDGSIELAVRSDGDLAVLSVSDDGTGIGVSDIGSVFQRFARADAGRSRSAGGFGLGLPIVKAIAEAHGGQVRVSSVPGHGSVFELAVPLAPAGPASALKIHDRGEAVSTAGDGTA